MVDNHVHIFSDLVNYIAESHDQQESANHEEDKEDIATHLRELIDLCQLMLIKRRTH